jgi:hypothetical protein
MVQAAPVVSQSTVTAPCTSLNVLTYAAGQPLVQSHTTPLHSNEGLPAENAQPVCVCVCVRACVCARVAGTACAHGVGGSASS